MNEIRITAAIAGTAFCQWLGGIDGLLTALIAFMVVDYISGVSCAIVEHKLSSSIGAKGIFQKVLILMLVGVANALDTYIIEVDKLPTPKGGGFCYQQPLLKNISLTRSPARVVAPTHFLRYLSRHLCLCRVLRHIADKSTA